MWAAGADCEVEGEVGVGGGWWVEEGRSVWVVGGGWRGEWGWGSVRVGWGEVCVGGG